MRVRVRVRVRVKDRVRSSLIAQKTFFPPSTSAESVMPEKTNAGQAAVPVKSMNARSGGPFA